MANTTTTPPADPPQVPPGGIEALATDPTPPVATPTIMTDAYVQIGTANLSCLGLEVHVDADNKPVELITFCGVRDYPGPTKWHFKAKLAQSFDVGATDATLTAALNSYVTAGTLCPVKVRPYKSRAVSPTNPSFEGNVIPQPYELFGGTAGSASEVDIDWVYDQPPTRVTA